MSNSQYLNWSARTDRRQIGTAGGTRNLLVSVAAGRREEAAARRRPPLNLGLVLDASGSMAGEPLAAACEAARAVVARLDAADRLTLVSFADDVILHCDAVPVDAAGSRRALAALEQLHTRGCTDLAAGWLAGCRLVAAAMEPADAGATDTLRRAPTQNRVIVLSDGCANRGIVDPAELAHHAGELRRRGLTTSAIGIGDHYSPVQLDAIAEHGGGRVHDAPTGEDIVAVVLGELGEILETAAEDINVTFHLPQGCGCEVFGRYPVEQSAGIVVVNLGSLVSGAERHLVLQLTLPAGRIGDTHRIEVVPDWRDPAGGTRVRGRALTAELVVSTETEVHYEAPDQSVAGRVARFWQSHLATDAVLLNTVGRCDEAEKVLRRSTDRFAEYCASVRGADEYITELSELRQTVGRPMAPSVALDCVMLAKSRLKGNQDHRRTSRR